ncbi:18317_t:CDS:2, partial [Racocetra persica]
MLNKKVEDLESELDLYKNPEKQRRKQKELPTKKDKKRNAHPTTDSTGDREGTEARNSQAEEREKGPYEDRTTMY